MLSACCQAAINVACIHNHRPVIRNLSSRSSSSTISKSTDGHFIFANGTCTRHGTAQRYIHWTCHSLVLLRELREAPSVTCYSQGPIAALRIAFRCTKFITDVHVPHDKWIWWRHFDVKGWSVVLAMAMPLRPLYWLIDWLKLILWNRNKIFCEVVTPCL